MSDIVRQYKGFTLPPDRCCQGPHHPGRPKAWLCAKEIERGNSLCATCLEWEKALSFYPAKEEDIGELQEEERKAAKTLSAIRERIVLAREGNLKQQQEAWRKAEAHVELRMASKALNIAMYQAFKAGVPLPAKIEGDIPEEW